MGDLLSYFSYSHLPENLQSLSRPFHDLATEISTYDVADYEELKMGLHKLLEAKDCIVRAAIRRGPQV